MCETQILESGTLTFDIPAGAVGIVPNGYANVTFPVAFRFPPNMTFTINYQNYTAALTPSLQSSFTLLGGNRTVQWKNMPAATTELFGNTFNRIDMLSIQAVDANVLLSVNVVTPGTASAVLELQFSATPTGPWTDPCSGSADVSIASAGLQENICGFLPIGSAGPYVRIVGKNGNGIVSPTFGLITIAVVSDTFETPIHIDACLFAATGGTCNPTNAITRQFFLLSIQLFMALNFDSHIVIGWMAIECIVGSSYKSGFC